MHSEVTEKLLQYVSLLTTGCICEMHFYHGFMWHYKHTKFNGDRISHSSNIKVITSTIW
jgi:hypothetical protein